MKDIQIRRDKGSIPLSELYDFERLIGHILPQSYKTLLSEHNALFPLEPDFKFFNSEIDDYDTRDISFYGFGNSIPDYSRITRALDHDVIGHDGVIAFGSAANGDYICFDYRNISIADNPKIAVMLHDQRDNAGKMPVCFVADSFEEFVDMLHEAEED